MSNFNTMVLPVSLAALLTIFVILTSPVQAKIIDQEQPQLSHPQVNAELRQVALESSEQPYLQILRDIWLLATEELDTDIELYILPTDDFAQALAAPPSADTRDDNALSPYIDWFIGLHADDIEAASLHQGPLILTRNFTLYQRRHLPALERIEDAAGFVIGVLAESRVEHWLAQNYPQLTLRRYAEMQELIEDAHAGRLHVFAGSGLLAGLRPGEPAGGEAGVGEEGRPGLLASLSYAFPNSRRLPLFNENLYVAMRGAADEEQLQAAFSAVNTEHQRYILSRAHRDIASLVSLQADELEWLATQEDIQVGVPTDSRPILFFDRHGEAVGLDADFLDLMSQRSALNFIYSGCGNWEACLDALAQRNIDVLSFVSDTPARRQFAAFTSPYWETPWAIAALGSGAIGAERLEDIAQKRIAITRSYSIFDYASSLANLEVYPVDSPEEGLIAVLEGRADGYLDSLPLLVERVREQQTGNLHLTILHGEPGDVVTFAVRGDWPVLRDILDRAVNTLTAEDQLQIAERWFDVNFEPGLRFADVRRWLLYGGAVSVLLVGFFIMWNSRLRREVRRRHLAENRMRHIARHDDLTGLPNRHLLEDRLKQVLASHQRYKRQFAVLFLDLDGFKEVNDAQGHDVGDALLKQVATRLSESVRAQDTVCRFGGDEFIIILTEQHNSTQAMRVAQKLVDRIIEPYVLDFTPTADQQAQSISAQVSVSIGVAMFPGHSRNTAELMRLADKAMYAVKREGKNGVRMAPGLQ